MTDKYYELLKEIRNNTKTQEWYLVPLPKRFDLIQLEKLGYVAIDHIIEKRTDQPEGSILQRKAKLIPEGSKYILNVRSTFLNRNSLIINTILTIINIAITVLISIKFIGN